MRCLSFFGSSEETPTEVFKPILDRIATGVEDIFKGSISMGYPEYFKKWLGVGYDQGPNQLIKFISSQTSCVQLSFNSNQIESIEGITNYISENDYQGLLCGTSQSDLGFKFESNIRQAATLLGLPVICIEDFPGNYRGISGSNTEILVVEGDFSINIYKDKLPHPSHTIVCPSIRYDHLRSHQTNLEGIKKNSTSFSVLWAGQPEFEVNLSTLKTIIPALNELSVIFLFKAHPNDTEFRKGSYEKYFNEAGLRWLDVSSAKIDSSLFDQVDLVMTQFSSVAIEAGFYGIPSLNILLEDAGQKLLIERTGFATTSIIDSGASFVIREKKGILDYLKMCLTDLSARKKVMTNFDRVYETRQTQLPKLLLEIKDIIHTVIKK